MSSKKHLTRRDFLKIVAVGGIAGLTAKFTLDAYHQDQSVSETRLLMGTLVNMTIVSGDLVKARTAVQACLDRMARLETVLSRFIPESQLSQLNRSGCLEQADPALLYVIAESLKISQLSDGAFDITVKPVLDAQQAGRVPTDTERAAVGYQNLRMDNASIEFLQPGMGLTLDGIAKGFVVDRGVEVSRSYGFENIIVEAGGDLSSQGQRADGKAWKLGVVNPHLTADPGYLTTFSVTNQAVATSGDYLQHYNEDKSQHHIIDPSTGSSPPELASVTVLAPSAMLADALSTTVMVLGLDRGLQFVHQFPEVEALLVSKDEQVYRTNNFPHG